MGMPIYELKTFFSNDPTVDHFPFLVQCKLLALAEQVSYCKLRLASCGIASVPPPRHQHPRCFHCKQHMRLSRDAIWRLQIIKWRWQSDSHQLTSCNYKPLTRSLIKKLRFKVQSTWEFHTRVDEKQEKTSNTVEPRLFEPRSSETSIKTFGPS